VTPAGEPTGGGSGTARPGLAMRECRACGQVVFPPRPLCPRCGAWRWKVRVAERGVIVAVTRRGEMQLVSVRTDDGPTVTAVAPEGDLAVRTRVLLESEGLSDGRLRVRALRRDDLDT
jgi:rubredoxin-like zinc ribbon protein